MSETKKPDLPSVRDLMYPVLMAVMALGGSAQGGQITSQVLNMIGATDEQLAITYPNRPKQVLIDRIEWARSYDKLAGLLDSPQRGLFLLTALAKDVISLPQQEGKQAIRALELQVRKAAHPQKGTTSSADEPAATSEAPEDTGWMDVLLARLHQLSPAGFEEFVMYLLRTYGMELTRVGGTGDRGIDGIGTAPISPVLSSRVAVQAKRYDPGSAIGREVVALFQRDAAAAGAERAVLVTLGHFSAAARDAATTTTPTVDLIDGQRLCELVRSNGENAGVRFAPVVQQDWFDRFE